jgi:hypothetical protein
VNDLTGDIQRHLKEKCEYRGAHSVAADENTVVKGRVSLIIH